MLNSFRHWFIFTCFLAFLHGLCLWQFNLWQSVILADKTFVTLIIMIAFWIQHLVFGFFLYQKQGVSQSRLEGFYGNAETILTLGLIGTMLGMVIVLRSPIDPSNITPLMQGMATSLYTTLAALFYGVILTNELFYLFGYAKK